MVEEVINQSQHTYTISTKKSLESQSRFAICSDVLFYLMHIPNSLAFVWSTTYIMDAYTEISIDYMCGAQSASPQSSWINRVYDCTSFRIWKATFVCVWHLLVLSLKLLTFSGVSQLSTHNSSIAAIPGVITHGAPLFVHADLHSAFIWNVTSHQSKTIWAWSYV